jgi:hypothetical protein
MLESLLSGLGHAIVYAVLAGLLLVVAYFVLDLVTPGHLGARLRGIDENGDESVHAASRSAGVVTAAWLFSNAMVLFTAIWMNGETALGWALAATLAFGALGIALNAVMFFAIEAVTRGDLRRTVTLAGPVRPLAYVAASAALSVGLIVCASIA